MRDPRVSWHFSVQRRTVPKLLTLMDRRRTAVPQLVGCTERYEIPHVSWHASCSLSVFQGLQGEKVDHCCMSDIANSFY
jgi:hypothetical protein